MMTSSQSAKNFCNKDIGAEIYTSALTVDHYEVENLINQSNLNGFMAEYFIKCPVELLLTFPCMIDISNIILTPKLMSHQSKCIEIYSLSQQINKNKELVETENTQNNDLQFLLKMRKENFPYSIDLARADKLKELHRTFKMVGKYNISRHATKPFNNITFTKRNNRQRFRNSSTDLILDLNNHPSLSHCTHLLIRITWATIPVLAGLKVLATLSMRNPKPVRTLMTSIIEKLNQSKLTAHLVNEAHESVKSKVISESTPSQSLFINREENDCGMPTEFIDPITLNLMTVPVLLPCGKTVDKVTLERYLHEQSIYGRLPSDPFTGVTFSDDRKPVPNVGLKLRIDSYLLENKHIKITSGVTGWVAADGSTLNAVNNAIDIRKRKNTSPPSDLVTPPKKVSNIGIIDQSSHQITSKSKPSVIDLTVESHEDELKRSLDLSLFNTIPYLPHIDRKPSVIDQSRKVCAVCNLSSKHESFYELPCSHVLCRNCLEKCNRNSCEVCKRSFERKNVVRIHQ